MSALFDTLKYTKGAIEAGTPREQAEYQAEQLNKIIDEQLVTKAHLDTRLKELELRLIIKLGIMMFLQTGLIIGVLGLILKH